MNNSQAKQKSKPGPFAEPDPVVRNFHLDLPEKPLELHFRYTANASVAGFVIIWTGVYRAFLEANLPADIARQKSENLLLSLFLVCLILVIVKAIVTWNWKVTVSRQGLTFSRGSKIIQDCPWSEMTLKKKFYLLPALADQNQKLFPFGIFTNGAPDNLKAAKYLGQQLQTLAPLNTRRVRWLCVIFILLGAVGLMGYLGMSEFAPRAYATRQANPFDPTKLQPQLLWFGISSWLVLLWLLIPVYLYIYSALLPYLEFRNAAYKQRDELAVVEISRKELHFEQGVWYGYGKIIDKSLSERAISTVGLICSLGTAYFICSVVNRTWPYAGALVGAILVPTMAAILFYLWANAAPFKRGFEVKLRKQTEHFEVLAEGKISLLTPLSFNQNDLRSGARFGGLKWNFRSKEGVLYTFDPRFMMPVETTKFPD